MKNSLFVLLVLSMLSACSEKNANQNDLIFWFHGWGNNIDSAVKRYALTQQFAASRLNAVLVLAETAKDAPDSYGGKLEQAGAFKDLVQDVFVELKRQKVISTKCKPGNIILAGHSGAYRVMAYILQNGNLPVKSVILFDALYGETNKFMDWIKADASNRFIDIYTDGGGTDVESKKMVNLLIKEKKKADTIEEKDLTNQQLQSGRIIFIHSLKKHNDIINNPDNFQFFIQNIPFMKKIKE